jgi:MinD superfamily P-loop ATPase
VAKEAQARRPSPSGVGEKVLVFPELCHGCGSCTLNCPTGAIHEVLVVGYVRAAELNAMLRELAETKEL